MRAAEVDQSHGAQGLLQICGGSLSTRLCWELQSAEGEMGTEVGLSRWCSNSRSKFDDQRCKGNGQHTCLNLWGAMQHGM